MLFGVVLHFKRPTVTLWHQNALWRLHYIGCQVVAFQVNATSTIGAPVINKNQRLRSELNHQWCLLQSAETIAIHHMRSNTNECLLVSYFYPNFQVRVRSNRFHRKRSFRIKRVGHSVRVAGAGRRKEHAPASSGNVRQPGLSVRVRRLFDRMGRAPKVGGKYSRIAP